MTMVAINSKTLNDQFQNCATINEVISELIDTSQNEEGVITGVKLDGHLYDTFERKDLLATTLNQYEAVEFVTQTNLELASEALDSCNDYINLGATKITEIVEIYAGNETQQANEHFSEIVDIIDGFIQLMSHITRTIKDYGPEDFVKSQEMTQLELHLLSSLKALVPAKEKEDIIMVCDLLEYELLDNLIQWKEKVIPTLKEITLK
jgi:hypothetical protein